MVIYNKTSQVQELGVYDRSTQRGYSIFVNSHSSTNLDAYTTAPTLKKLVAAGIFQILDEPPVKDTYEELKVESDGKDDCDHKCGDQECSGHCEGDETLEGNGVENSEPPANAEVSETENETLEGTEEGESEDETSEVPEDSKFICKICGGEFASARGLSRHMNSAHANEA